MRELDFRRLGWTDVDLLIEVLHHARPPHLQRLLLHDNPFTDATVAERVRRVLPEGVLLGIDEVDDGLGLQLGAMDAIIALDGPAR